MTNCFILITLRFGGVSETYEEEQRVPEHETYGSNNDTYLGHVLCSDKSGRVGQCVRRSTYREQHRKRSAQDRTYEQSLRPA